MRNLSTDLIGAPGRPEQPWTIVRVRDRNEATGPFVKGCVAQMRHSVLRDDNVGIRRGHCGRAAEDRDDPRPASRTVVPNLSRWQRDHGDPVRGVLRRSHEVIQPSDAANMAR